MLALIALIVLIILMILWLFGGWYVVGNPNASGGIRVGTGTIIPWLCVFIIALFVFGAFGPIVFSGPVGRP